MIDSFEALEILFGVAWAVWLGFLVWYTVRSRWWGNKYGKNMFGVGLDIFAFWFLAWLLLAFGWHPMMLWPWLALVVHNIWMGGRRTYFMEMAQRERRRDH